MIQAAQEVREAAPVPAALLARAAHRDPAVRAVRPAPSTPAKVAQPVVARPEPEELLAKVAAQAQEEQRAAQVGKLEAPARELAAVARVEARVRQARRVPLALARMAAAPMRVATSMVVVRLTRATPRWTALRRTPMLRRPGTCPPIAPTRPPMPRMREPA
jgi:hypothetical protein